MSVPEHNTDRSSILAKLGRSEISIGQGPNEIIDEETPRIIPKGSDKRDDSHGSETWRRPGLL